MKKEEFLKKFRIKEVKVTICEDCCFYQKGIVPGLSKCLLTTQKQFSDLPIDLVDKCLKSPGNLIWEKVV